MKISQAFYELHTFPVFIVWSRKPYHTANFTSVWQNHIILQTRAVRTLMPCCAHVSFPVFIFELWSRTHFQPANFYMRLAKSHYIASTCCAHSDAMLYTCEFSWIYFIGARASHQTFAFKYITTHELALLPTMISGIFGLQTHRRGVFRAVLFSPTPTLSRPWNQHIIATKSTNPGHSIFVVVWKWSSISRLFWAYNGILPGKRP